MQAIKLHAKQLDIVKALDKTNKNIVVSAGRRSGKSFLNEYVTLLYMARGLGVLYTTPIAQQSDDYWRHIKQYINSLGLDYTKDENRRTLLFDNGGYLKVTSLSNGADRVRGMGSNVDLIIVDEAAHLPDLDNIMKYILTPLLLDNKGRFILTSTPNGYNDFYKYYSMGDNWLSFKFTSYDNPHVASSMLDDIREQSSFAVFNQEYLANFTSRADSVFYNWHKAHIELIEFDNTHLTYTDNAIIAAVDLANSGDNAKDYSAISVWYVADDRAIELYVGHYREPNHYDLIQALQAIVDKYCVRRVYVESNNLGHTLIEAMAKTFACRVIAHHTTNKTKIHAADNIIWSIERNKSVFYPSNAANREMQQYTVYPTKNTVRYAASYGNNDDMTMARMIAWLYIKPLLRASDNAYTLPPALSFRDFDAQEIDYRRVVKLWDTSRYIDDSVRAAYAVGIGQEDDFIKTIRHKINRT